MLQAFGTRKGTWTTLRPRTSWCSAMIKWQQQASFLFPTIYHLHQRHIIQKLNIMHKVGGLGIQVEMILFTAHPSIFQLTATRCTWSMCIEITENRAFTIKLTLQAQMALISTCIVLKLPLIIHSQPHSLRFMKRQQGLIGQLDTTSTVYFQDTMVLTNLVAILKLLQGFF